MKNLLIISPCSFTRMGFSNLAFHERMSDVKITHIESYKGILSHIEEETIPSGPSLIIIDMTVRLRRLRAKQFANIWNLRQIMPANSKLRNIPCVIFGIQDQSQLTSLHWISSQTTVESLIDKIDNIYRNIEEYTCSNEIKQKILNEQQKMVLEQLMKGYSIQNLSLKINKSPHNLFYSRDRLIEKLGLNDRYDFIFLSGELIL